MDEQNDRGFEPPHFYANWEKYHGRGVIAQAHGHYEEAVVQFSIAAFVLVVDTLPAAKICRAASLTCLASVYLALERHDKALPLLVEAMALREGLIPQCSTVTAETLHLMANAQHGLKQYAEASACYQHAVDYLHQLLPLDHEYTKQVVGNWLVSAAEWNAREELAEQGDSRKSA